MQSMRISIRGYYEIVKDLWNLVAHLATSLETETEFLRDREALWSGPLCGEPSAV